jgi:hypothetical protein
MILEKVEEIEKKYTHKSKWQGWRWLYDLLWLWQRIWWLWRSHTYKWKCLLPVMCRH